MDAHFRAKMDKLLKEQGMTQRELAARLGVSEVTVSRWMTAGENGRNPSVQTLQRIAEVLGTTPDYLLEKDAPEKEPEQKSVAGLGEILSGVALTATAVIGIVALAKALGKLTEKDAEDIKDILDRE